MANALVEKIRRARERSVKVGERTVTIRRPTDAEALQMQGKGWLDFVLRFVVGWDFQELDLIPGGDAKAVEFDKDLWTEWISDHPDHWEAIATAVMNAYGDHAKAREGDAKN